MTLTVDEEQASRVTPTSRLVADAAPPAPRARDIAYVAARLSLNALSRRDWRRMR